MSVMTNEYRDTLQRLEVLSISLLIQQRIKFLDIGLERERHRETQRDREREREQASTNMNQVHIESVTVRAALSYKRSMLVSTHMPT
jgi:hypothetical protein